MAAMGKGLILNIASTAALPGYSLKQLDANLEWQNLEIDLSQFSGPEGDSFSSWPFMPMITAIDASGWAIDNVVIYSDQIPQEVIRL